MVNASFDNASSSDTSSVPAIAGVASAKNRYYDLRPLEAGQSPASGGNRANPARSVFRLRPRGER